jgi:hypothetical protein
MRFLGFVLMVAACGGGGGFPTDGAPEAQLPKGKFAMTWAVTDSGGNPISCAQVGGNFVTVTLKPQGGFGSESESFSCASLMSTSLLSFAPGIYDFSFELIGNGRLSVGPQQLAVEIKSNETTNLAPVAFAVDATGKLELFVNTGVTGGNCTGGAGVATTLISLTHQGGGPCEAVTFAIAAGASEPAGTYTIDCTTPFNGCIDADQKLTVTSLPSGGYNLSVNARVGAAECYKGAVGLTVPAMSATLMQTLNLTQQTTGC